MDKFYGKFVGRTINQTPDDGKWYVVGDIHGQYDLLMEQLDEIGFDFDTDKLFSVGDLVDRGPKSWECLMLTYETWFDAVLGNHEAMMYDAIASGLKHLWWQNGGSWWDTEGHAISLCDRSEAISIICDMPNYLTLNLKDGSSVGIIHASANGRQWPPKQTSIDPWGDPTIWCRKFLHGTVPKVSGVDLVIVGHNPTDKPKLENNTLHIDTGYKTGRLSIIDIEEALNENSTRS